MLSVPPGFRTHVTGTFNLVCDLYFSLKTLYFDTVMTVHLSDLWCPCSEIFIKNNKKKEKIPLCIVQFVLFIVSFCHIRIKAYTVSYTMGVPQACVT